MILQWLRSLRQQQPITSDEIRRQLTGLRHQGTETIRRRDALALDAVCDDGAAERWAALDDAARNLERQIAVLTAALPQAEAHEAEAARQAEAVRRERAMADYQRHTQDANQAIAAVVAHLPTGETLTALRELSNRLAGEARALRGWSTDSRVRRPLDPLNEVLEEMQHIITRVERSRWAPHFPITLNRARTNAVAVAEAVERVERLDKKAAG